MEHEKQVKQTPILIVDDQGMISDDVVEQLKLKGFSQINIARNASEAMGRLKLEADGTRTALAVTPGVIIVNVELAGAGAFLLCDCIKENSPETLVVLMLRVQDIDDYHNHLVVAKADDLLFFPFNISELTSKLRLLVARLKNKIIISENEANASFQLPHVGDSIAKYTIIDTLGFGKYSVIYKVLDSEDGKIYAIKLLTKYALHFDRAVEDFEREIEIMSSINHPNIIKFYKSGLHDNCPYIVMEFIKGSNLEDYLLVNGVPDVTMVFQVSTKIAEALKCIHEHGLTHRDIKLSNIMLANKGKDIVLADFGIARKENSSAQADSQMKHLFVTGTPMYMAPELFKGEKSSIKTDIYSFGITLYHFITASPPFSGDSTEELAKMHQGKVPALIRLKRPEIPLELEKLIIDGCMAKKSCDRPETMAVFLEKIYEAQERYSRGRQQNSGKGASVLFVDDEENIINSLRRLFIDEPYEFIGVNNAEDALKVLAERKIEVLVTDHRMPGMSGVELTRKVHEQWPDIVSIILSGQAGLEEVVEGVNKGHIYKFLSKPWLDEEVLYSVKTALDKYELEAKNRLLLDMLSHQNKEVRELNISLETKVEARTLELKNANLNLRKYFDGIVETFVGIMEMHSAELSLHCSSVAEFSTRIAELSGRFPGQTTALEIAALLHDVGKISFFVNANTIKLNQEKELLLAQHPGIAFKMLSTIPEFKNIAEMVKHHHENFSGGGFPEGLSGRDIPIGSRIIAAADEFVKVLYMKNGALRKREFVEESMNALSGNRLDPDLVRIIIKDIIPIVYESKTQTAYF
jgi:response regulator RpfG family c-di-GMP phosphodiesterase/tRNA A-37 threonylcarbamoyl transferase component Bud32